MFSSIVVGTDGSETAGKAVLQATELARQVGASVEPRLRVRAGVAATGSARSSARCPKDMEWMVNPREDVEATLKEAAEKLEGAGVKVDTFAREGDPADAILDVAEETERRPDRGRQQGHDRRPSASCSARCPTRSPTTRRAAC